MPLLLHSGILSELLKSENFCEIFIIFFQKTELIKNIEKLTFWAGDNEKLHFAKQELLSQINNLDISISGKGFFTIDRQFLAGVYTVLKHVFISIKFRFISRWPQLVALISSSLFNSICLESENRGKIKMFYFPRWPTYIQLS